ncbi:efflux RND transporter permease subunit [Fischerella sp. PCC 9605]|uniref:efflux RND transporter permease subunit n=1 Tax=Fischerella sp. PCC 9605 TaxID=1173024 RepID=UPI00047BD18A|nr:efflux RND transporter permease subunit [Fischerella sp. PCC 9605]
MSVANNFIKRPVLTTVCTILIVLIGAVCIPLLPINYLPDIAPIQVNVSAGYTGADVDTVENTVTTILEREINGVENMEYMTSNTYPGTSQVSVLFPTNTDKNIDQVNVQNRVAQALPQLPSVVQQLGVSTKTASTSILQVYSFYAENGEYDGIFIGNYLDLYVTDVLKRVPGVGDISTFGDKPNAMRLWLDPNALASRGLTTLDVANALKSQNIVIGAGSIGQEPVPEGQTYQMPLRIQSRFKDTSEFENLVIKTGSNGSTIRLKDVGRAELGAENYNSNALVKGKPAVGLAIYQSPGSNALDLAENIHKTVEELQRDFPPGLKAEVVYDTTAFIEISVEEVFKTLLEAFVLVVLVIFIFLQDWRTTIIPLVAIPVSLIGAMAFAFLFGFSINNLTLFGLILATGLVVDDAIIVVEAVAAKMEQGMKPKQATFEAMQELTGAIISMSLVLMAVFIPVAFFPGSTGKLYQQFALVIAFSIAVSCFNALSFSPSMSAILLRSQHAEGRGPLNWFFRKFNRFLNWFIGQYKSFVKFLIGIRYIVMAVFVAGLFATYYMFGHVPTGFVPNEDQGVFLGIIQAPDGVSLSYTDKVANQVQKALGEIPEVETYFTATGAGLSGAGPNQGLFFVKLQPWEERTTKEASVDGVVKRLNQKLAQIQDAKVFAFNIPPIPGFSAQGGFELQLQDKTGGKFSIDNFLAIANDIIAKANQKPALQGQVYTQFTAGTPQLEINIDRNKLEALNVDFQQALQTLSAAIGSSYVNDFTLGTRSYKVYVQADGNYRNSPDDINKLYVRSRDNKMVSLGELATLTPITGPQIINHYNGYRSINIQGQEAPGYSSGQALQAMDETVKQAAVPGIGSDWIGLAKEQLSAGSLGALIFLFGIIMVFLTLAAQYESYIDPLIILLTVPLALLGALVALDLRSLINDVYANIALVMLIGLAAKNAILIVEFANLGREQGMSLVKAAVTAAEERFRPIVMTAAAALAGFWPLVIASGAGAASRVSLGTALFGGLLLNTVLALLVVPVLYVVIKGLEDRFLSGKPPQPPEHLDSSTSDSAAHPELQQTQPAPRFQSE